MENKNVRGGGIGFSSLLGLVFITLKLCGVIKWKWLWVLAPFWISAGLTILILLIVLIIELVANR